MSPGHRQWPARDKAPFDWGSARRGEERWQNCWAGLRTALKIHPHHNLCRTWLTCMWCGTCSALPVCGNTCTCSFVGMQHRSSQSAGERHLSWYRCGARLGSRAGKRLAVQLLLHCRASWLSRVGLAVWALRWTGHGVVLPYPLMGWTKILLRWQNDL